MVVCHLKVCDSDLNSKRETQGYGVLSDETGEKFKSRTQTRRTDRRILEAESRGGALRLLLLTPHSRVTALPGRRGRGSSEQLPPGSSQEPHHPWHQLLLHVTRRTVAG